MQVAERWIQAALRNGAFFSLPELNEGIRCLLARINERPFRHMPGCRRELFEQLDRPVLGPLPAERYQWIWWKTAKVSIDYHVKCDDHLYSVQYQLVGERVDLRPSPAVVEILHKGRRVASHLRIYARGKFTADTARMPSAHRRYSEWAPCRLVAWAAEVGPDMAAPVRGMLELRPHRSRASVRAWDWSDWPTHTPVSAWRPLAKGPSPLRHTPLPVRGFHAAPRA